MASVVKQTRLMKIRDEAAKRLIDLATSTAKDPAGRHGDSGGQPYQEGHPTYMLDSDQFSKQVQVKASAYMRDIEWAALHTTTQEQRHRYGGERGAAEWHKDYVLLERETLWDKSDGAGVVGTVLLRMESTRFGRFQRAFSHEYSAVAPRRFVEDASKYWSGDFKKDWKEYLNKVSLQGVLVLPDRISDELVKKLGLVDPDAKLTTRQLIELKNTPKVIDSIKMLFESSVQLPVRSVKGELNERIWVIKEPDVSSKLRYPQAQDVGAEWDGSIIYYRGDYTTENSSGKRKQSGASATVIALHRQVPAIYDSAYKALRGVAHKDSGYLEELMRLAPLVASATDITKRVDADWHRDTSKELKTQMKAELLTFVEKAVPVLLSAKHAVKREAREKIESVYAELQREPANEEVVVSNVRAILSMITGLRNRLSARQEDITAKSAHNAEDKSVVLSFICQQEVVFEELHQTASSTEETLKRYRDFFDRRRVWPPAQLEPMAKEILAALSLDRRRLEPIVARPFLTFAKAMHLVVTDLETAVKNRDLDATKEALVGYIAISKLAQANACIEVLKRYATFCDQPFDSFEKAAAKLSAILSRREIFKGVEVEKYKVEYSNIERRFAALAERFSELKTERLDDIQRLVKFGEICDFFHDPKNNIELIVATMMRIPLAPESRDLDVNVAEPEDVDPDDAGEQ